MKKLFVMLLGTLIISSCNKDAEKQSCLPPATVTKIYLETEHGKQGFDFHVFESERSMGYYALISLISENTYREILKGMLPQLTDETVRISMVVNGSANQKSFKKEDIIGFVSVGVENKRYRMKAYTIEDGRYILDPIMNIRTVAIRTRFENLIRNRAYELYPNTNIHIVTLNKKNQNPIEIDKSMPDEFYIFKKKLRDIQESKVHGPIGGGGYCGHPCNDPVNAECVQGNPDDPDNRWCDEVLCFSENFDS